MFFWWPLNHQKSMSVEQKLSWTLQPDALPPWYNNSLSGSTGVVALDNLPWSVLDLPPFDIIVWFIFHCLCCDFLCARHHDCTVFLLIFFHFYFPEFVIFFFLYAHLVWLSMICLFCSHCDFYGLYSVLLLSCVIRSVLSIDDTPVCRWENLSADDFNNLGFS